MMSPPSTDHRRAQLLLWLTILVVSYVAQYALTVIAFWILGHAALAGRVDHGWLVGWALVLLTLTPLRLLSRWSEGVLALGLGGLIKSHLFAIVLQAAPERIRREGMGVLLGKIHESETMETYLLNGGLQAIVGGVELAFACGVLAVGAGGLAHALVLVVWVVLLLGVGRRYLKRRRIWTRGRIGITRRLVEQILGHTTRMVQQSSGALDDADDRRLSALFATSRAMESASAALLTLLPRAWLPVGILCLGPALIGPAEAIPSLLVALGGVLLGLRGLRRLALGTWYLVGAFAGWYEVKTVLAIAAEPEIPPVTEFAPGAAVVPAPSRDHGSQVPVLAARGLRFSYPERRCEVLRGLELDLKGGARVVLRGPTGAGKSTLARILGGQMPPAQGVVLLSGVDRASLGAEVWRRHVAVVPPFHDNHIVAGTLASNLLLGRPGRLTAVDREEAMSLCRELGLEGLVARMPRGLDELVGDGGWKLSHGEQCRVFLARGLLQGASVVVVDETLDALDPETFLITLDSLDRRAPVVLLIEGE